MSIFGIVCEYNPFHLGHLYQMEESRRLLGNDSLCICVMSGDFVQRGEAAMFTKFVRAEAACCCGADIVLELPVPWSLSSAEGFARASVEMLAAAGCTHISFGSESGDLDKLKKIAEFASSEAVRQNVKALYKCSAALPYAKVRQLAIKKEIGDDADMLSLPNNILAVEYLKAIISKKLLLEPITIKRVGNGHDESGAEGPKSASELRAMLENNIGIEKFIPQAAAEIYRREINSGRMKNQDRLDIALLSRLRMFEETYFDTMPDAADGAGRRLYKAVREYNSSYDVAYYASTRPYPFARMRRTLLCAALGVSAEYTKLSPPYLRVLAANEKGRAHLRNISEVPIPLLTKASAVRTMSDYAQKVFALGASAHDLYRLQFVTNDDRKCGEDWRKGPMIVQN